MSHVVYVFEHTQTQNSTNQTLVNFERFEEFNSYFAHFRDNSKFCFNCVFRFYEFKDILENNMSDTQNATDPFGQFYYIKLVTFIDKLSISLNIS